MPIQATGSGTTNGTAGNDTIFGTAGADNIYGGAGDDIIFGYDGADNVRGTAGFDTLYGGAGNDQLDGGTDDDIMYGGTGNDTYVVDSIRDQVFELDGEGTEDHVKASISYTLGDTLENLTLTGMQNLTGTGNASGNDIHGNAGDNLLFGLGGNDGLLGGLGNDVLAGGAGDDYLLGEGGADCFDFDVGDVAAISASDFIADLNFAEHDEICLDGYGTDGGDLTLRSYADIGTFLKEHPEASVAHSLKGDNAVLTIVRPDGHVQSINIGDASGQGSSWVQIQPFLPPVAGADSATTGENSQVAIDVLANDTGPSPLTLTGAAAPAGQGSAVVDGGLIRFDPGTDFDYLPAGQSAVVVLTYTVETPFGRTATGTVAVTVVGANDAAIIGGVSTGAVVEDGQQTAAGKLTVDDVDVGEASFQAGTIAGSYGALALAADGTWTYTLNNAAAQSLAGGQVVNDAITVKSADGTSKVVSVAVTGTNDLATIGGTAIGAVVEDGQQTATGKLTIADADAGEASFRSGTVAGSYGALAIAADGTWKYTLDNAAVQFLKTGETRTDTVVIKSADGTAKSIAVTIKGTNDAAVIGGCDTGSVTEDCDFLAAGKLTIRDADTGGCDNFASGIYKGTYGYVLLTSDGGWVYLLNNFSDKLDTLNEGQHAFDTITIKAGDGTTHAISVTVNGQNECPTLANAFGGTGDVNDNDGFKAGAVTFASLSSGALSNANVAYGTTGGDTFDGKAGADTLYGWAGNDCLTGGAGDDKLFGGTGTDTLWGGTDNDTLFGGSGADTLYGEAGNDVLVGGFGADRLTGGAGADTFRFVDARDTGDTITDFTHGADKIDLSHLKVGSAEHDFDAPVNATRFSAGHDLIWYYEGGNTVVLGNTDGNPNTAEFVLTLNGRVDLGAGDFIL
ncbi:VCBS domain-containing protein [Sphingomonas sp.]|uniref:VCBS domain-containing protein n=1 Tax=Sphingomonas sp. TaxID=28214 RepID=UPI0035BC2CFA